MCPCNGNPKTTSGNGQPPGVKGARRGRPAPAAAQVGHKQKEMNKRRKESKSLLAVMRCLRASSQGGKVYKASGAKELAVTASMRAPVRDDVRAQLLPPCACPAPLPHGPRPGALYGSTVYSKLKFLKNQTDRVDHVHPYTDVRAEGTQTGTHRSVRVGWCTGL